VSVWVYYRHEGNIQIDNGKKGGWEITKREVRGGKTKEQRGGGERTYRAQHCYPNKTLKNGIHLLCLYIIRQGLGEECEEEGEAVENTRFEAV
jgi:hypothetical protein